MSDSNDGTAAALFNVSPRHHCRLYRDIKAARRLSPTNSADVGRGYWLLDR